MRRRRGLTHGEEGECKEEETRQVASETLFRVRRKLATAFPGGKARASSPVSIAFPAKEAILLEGIRQQGKCVGRELQVANGGGRRVEVIPEGGRRAR